MKRLLACFKLKRRLCVGYGDFLHSIIRRSVVIHFYDRIDEMAIKKKRTAFIVLCF